MISPKRILHVLGRTDRGGTESMLMNHYRNIDRRRLQFDFVTHTQDRCAFDDEIESLGGIIYHVPRFKVYNIFAYKNAWNRFFEEYEEYDTIHIHHFLVAGIILPIAEEHGVKVRIVHSHNTKPPIFLLKEKAMWLFHRDLIKHSTLRLACSDAAGKYLFGKATYHVFNNAIDTRKFRFDETQRNLIRKEFGIAEGTLVIGHVGSFRTRQKNHSFIIDVFADIYKKNENVCLLLVGEGELQQQVIDKAAELGVRDKCIFAGLRFDIPALLSAMDVFLFPSFFEGLSVVSVEVQASGLPCVASENITKETIMTDIFVQKNLAAPLTEWTNAILSIKPSKYRTEYCKEVTNAGYDVHDNIKKLEEYYIHE